jgi:hypothetical protein
MYHLDGVFGKSLLPYRLQTVSFLWANGRGVSWHIDDTLSCPDAVVLLSLKHFHPKDLAPLPAAYHMHFRPADNPSAEEVYAMEVPEGTFYVLEGPALKLYKHLVVMSLEQKEGKVALRLGFCKVSMNLMYSDCHWCARSGVNQWRVQ